ncbi:MAG: L-threonylcarbamoyladenylate synthase [Candidatus Edwardsbacteria bacterium]
MKTIKTEVIRIDNEKIEAEIIAHTAKVLKSGGIVVIPTDTVYGLACDAYNQKTIKRIFKIKKRAPQKSLILFCKREEISSLTSEIPLSAQKLMERFFPGPLTIILKASPVLPRWLVSKNGTVGIRLPQQSFVLTLLEKFHSPLATTSANLSGRGEPKSIEEVITNFWGKVELILDAGSSQKTSPSTVIDLTREPAVILRKGEISKNLLEETIGEKIKLERITVLFICTGNTCRSPLAQGYFQKIIPLKMKNRLIVISAGTAAVDGLPAAEYTQQVGLEQGFDLSRHRTRLLTDSLIKETDLIFAMESKHIEEILSIVPEASEKTFLLKQGGEISDPIGQPLEVYRQVFEEIKENIPLALERINQLLY